jgi:hypothetical protein
MSYDVTTEDVDATLAKTSTDELSAIVDRAGPIPPHAWRYLTAEQRRALRAQNLLARRQQAAVRTARDSAAAAEQRAAELRQQREAQAAAELEPLVEKKRNSREYL